MIISSSFRYFCLQSINVQGAVKNLISKSQVEYIWECFLYLKVQLKVYVSTKAPICTMWHQFFNHLIHFRLLHCCFLKASFIGWICGNHIVQSKTVRSVFPLFPLKVFQEILWHFWSEILHCNAEKQCLLLLYRHYVIDINHLS